MHAERITLSHDQTEDLRELLSYAQILEDWLLHAPDDILHELARFAYHEHFHPHSAAWWLIEDLGHLRCRLRKTLPGITTSKISQRLPLASRPSQRPEQDQRPLPTMALTQQPP
jgi:hypothetical protein